MVVPDSTGAVVNSGDWPSGVSAVSTPRPVLASVSEIPALSPLWWARRLYAKLQSRQESLKLFNRYYTGDHPLPWVAPQAEDSFRRILRMTRTNYMGLVVDATTERLEVLGFRVGNDWNGDAAAQAIWQGNNLDSFAGDAFLEAVKTGSSYMLVAPPRTPGGVPKVTIEHPSQVIVEYEPGDLRTRAAGLKVWLDDRVNRLMITLYLPNAIYKWSGERYGSIDTWEPRRVDGEEWPARNSLGVVPLVELPNNPQWTYTLDGTLIYGGVSEIADVIDAQDRINKTIADRLMTQDFGAFPQKWANNWEEDDEDDEDDGVDANGDPLPASKPGSGINIGRDRLLVATGDTTFGQFAAAPLDPYSNAKSEDVKDIASRTRTPSQYLLGEIVNVSGDALQAAESGLVSKVKQRQRPFAEALEEVMRIALLTTGDTRPTDDGMETIWRDPQYRTEAQLVDAVVKKFQVGLTPLRQAREDAGYSQRQIERMESADRADAVKAAVAARLATPAPPQQLPTEPPTNPLIDQNAV